MPVYSLYTLFVSFMKIIVINMCKGFGGEYYVYKWDSIKTTFPSKQIMLGTATQIYHSLTA